MFSSPFVKHLLGISYSPVTYSMLPGTSSDRHNSVWDSILGAKWDLIPRCEDVETSTSIRTMSFAENANFFSTISVTVTMCHGQFKGVENYRERVARNAEISWANQ